MVLMPKQVIFLLKSKQKMCKLKKYKKTSNTRMDECIQTMIINLKSALNDDYEIVGCCCGHGKYPMTIVIKGGFGSPVFDLVSGIYIPRKRKFYKKDSEGYYYIPEVNDEKDICECGHKQWDEHKCTFDPMVAQECNVKGCKCKKFKLRKLKAK